MSDDGAGAGIGAESAAAPVADGSMEAQASAGQLLRQAREAAGIDLAALAVALKVSAKKLEALESDRLDQLPDAVFLRGLASSVCRALKIEAAPVLARLPQSTAPRLDFDDPGLNAPFRTPGDEAKIPFWDRLSRPMVLAAMAVLMGALVLIFFPSSEQRAEIGAIVNRGSAPAVEGAVQAPAAQAAPAVDLPQAVASAAIAPVAPPRKEVIAKTPPPVAAAPVAPSAAAARPVQSVDAAPATASGDAVARKKVASTGVVVFKTSGPSWIEVTDANGAIQLSRMVEPGEPVGASGPLPLNVTVGRADVTEVTVRGKPFALDAVTRQGVARFEVK